MLMSKIYVVNSDMKNVRGMSDPNVTFIGPGPKNNMCEQKTFFDINGKRQESYLFLYLYYYDVLLDDLIQ